MELSQKRIGELSPQARIVLIVALGLAAVGAALFLLNRSHSNSASESGAAPSTPTTAATAPVVPATPVPSPAPAPTPVAPVTPVTPAQPPLPSAVSSPLDQGQIVVVALYSPTAKLDQIALAEAQAGAEKVHAAFASVDVTTSDVDGLAARFSVLHDPSVLVLRPPSELVVKLDGFADRDTVAQAAANAQP